MFFLSTMLQKATVFLTEILLSFYRMARIPQDIINSPFFHTIFSFCYRVL